MNLTELQKRRDVSIGNAARAASVEARKSHEGLARGYASQIASSQDEEKIDARAIARPKA